MKTVVKKILCMQEQLIRLFLQRKRSAGIFLFWLICLIPSVLPAAERIVSLGPTNTEELYLLGEGDKLVADSTYCIYPKAAREKEKIGSMLSISLEKIIAMRPDLVLATEFTSESDIEKLRHMGIQVEVFLQPDTFADGCANFRRMGKVLGKKEKAEKILADVKKDVAAIGAAVGNLPRKSVLLQIGIQPLFGAAPDSYTQDFILLAGGTNILEGQKDGRVRKEKVITLNPDVIIIAMMGSEGGMGAEAKKMWEEIPLLKAVRTKQIYLVNAYDVCSPSPVNFVYTLRRIALMIHPDIVLPQLVSNSFKRD